VARKHELRGMKVARNLRAAIERTLREVQDANDAGLSSTARGLVGMALPAQVPVRRVQAQGRQLLSKVEPLRYGGGAQKPKGAKQGGREVGRITRASSVVWSMRRGIRGIRPLLSRRAMPDAMSVLVVVLGTPSFAKSGAMRRQPGLTVHRSFTRPEAPYRNRGYTVHRSSARIRLRMSAISSVMNWMLCMDASVA